ncbi:MAG: holo-ACP synthase [Phycisphaerae bacterium]|nr:holo-ACP synthase [Phycisphaerae bacterium]
MNIISLGMDLIECSRVQSLLQRHQDRFLHRILTAREREHAARFRNSVPHIAGRFAAKEAILKVLGTGWRGQIAWTDMEITNDLWGKPHVNLVDACARRAAELGIQTVLLTITHTDNYAAATAIGIGEPDPDNS